MVDLAPIGVATYSRIIHLKKTIKALQANTLAKESELYIFLDAPKRGDKEVVSIVRKYIYTINGFKKVHIIERTTNSRVENMRGGLEYLLDTYGKAIFLEDDIVTAPGYLQFMNDALETYKDREDILSICGYSPELESMQNLSTDAYLIQSYLAWGTATWRDKYALLEPIHEKDYLELVQNPDNIEYVKKNCGERYIESFESEFLYENNYGDIRGTFIEYLKKMYTVYPKHSLVVNIGHDGTGQQCGITDKFLLKTSDQIAGFSLDKDMKINHIVKKEFLDFFAPLKENLTYNSTVIKNIMKQIEDSGLESLSMYGTTIYCDILLEELLKIGVAVNHFVNTHVHEYTYYKGEKVIPLQVAIDEGETNFLLASFGSRFIMKKNLNALTDKDLNIIMYEA